ncbi:MAG: glycoside hydrolase family 65 protein [Clostridiales bacterium]|nr:glycoside hydrolase family 65 protein [Clostridiales bacterium]
MGMDYSRINEWILREDGFDPIHLGKCEAIMCLGNGYLGLRSAAEERYLGETRDLLINGTFNKADPEAVTELPNAADMSCIELWINGERFCLDQGQTLYYSRELNVRRAELTRRVEWVSPRGDRVKLIFRRVVSADHLHAFAARVEVVPVSGDMDITVKSGIDGRVTNTGFQHFTEGSKRFFDNRYIQYIARTTQSDVSFVENTGHRFWTGGREADIKPQIYMDTRRVYAAYDITVPAGESLVIEKHSNVYTSRDNDVEGMTVAEIQALSLGAVKEQLAYGYERLAADTARIWQEKVWDRVPITIEGNDHDQFAIRFAQYHMNIMVPAHDSRMNIGAKGLSGEGYRGHCFWDTEIFLLPYYTFTQPEIARKLEEYRYLSLPGAHKKAAHNGYQGAMFPWEAAWLDDGEVTPEYMDVDILTGLPVKVWSGFIEQHITADVAFGVWQYYTISGDQDYMDRYGYELIFDTARFWVSRLEDKCRQIHETVDEATGEKLFSETVTEDGLYHICDVVGPDEYKEHKTDNAFTNYLAVWNMKKAMEYYELLKGSRREIFDRLNEKLGLDDYYALWSEKADRVFLPIPGENGVLPQDSTYLTLKDIDLSKYKAQDFVGGIMRDYNLTQINQIQVSKQADVLVLFFLMEDLFPHQVKEATWKYYAERTLHDSSLSLCSHAVLAADMREMDMAYDFFSKSVDIDMGPVMTTSDAGIHAASFGGIWQGVVYGFGGLRMLGGKLRIDPALPKEWSGLKYTFIWKGQDIAVDITHEQVKVSSLSSRVHIPITLCGEEKVLEDSLVAHR